MWAGWLSYLQLRLKSNQDSTNKALEANSVILRELHRINEGRHLTNLKLVYEALSRVYSVSGEDSDRIAMEVAKKAFTERATKVLSGEISLTEETSVANRGESPPGHPIQP